MPTSSGAPLHPSPDLLTQHQAGRRALPCGFFHSGGKSARHKEAWFGLSRYTNAADILPPPLLEALQRFAAGQQIYVPRPEERVPWGERSGARAALAGRNLLIRQQRSEGATIRQLMAEFHLGYESIRKILRGKNLSNRSGDLPPAIPDGMLKERLANPQTIIKARR